MKPEQPTRPGSNGKRNLDPHVRELIAEREVESSAERGPRHGPRPTRVSLDELVDMGRTVIDRVRPYVERGVGKLRARFHRK